MLDNTLRLKKALFKIILIKNYCIIIIFFTNNII